MSSEPPYVGCYFFNGLDKPRGLMQKVAVSKTRLSPGRADGAFTLLELLVVLGIIGLLISITLPAMKGMRQSNALASANRQLLDDLGAARQRAIKDGTVVMVLFAPPASQANANAYQGLNQQQKNILLRGQLTHYAMYAERSAGDQPGRRRPRYFTHGQVWRSLPDGLSIAAWKFPDASGNGGTNVPPFGFIPPFEEIKDVPIPSAASSVTNVFIPYIAFNARGQLVRSTTPLATGPFELAKENAIIPLARGSILFARDANQNLDWSAPDVAEKPPGNSVNNYNLIVIDKITGRARSETPQIK